MLAVYRQGVYREMSLVGKLTQTVGLEINYKHPVESHSWVSGEMAPVVSQAPFQKSVHMGLLEDTGSKEVKVVNLWQFPQKISWFVPLYLNCHLAGRG